MKQPSKILIGMFALVGVLSTGTYLTTQAFAQGSKGAVTSGEQGEKGEIEENEGNEQEVKMTSPVAKISPVQAIKAAEAKYGGKAGMAIFEFDEGHWGYGVVVVKNHKLIEVDVDPISGKVGATEAVTPDDEAVEFKDALTKLAKSN